MRVFLVIAVFLIAVISSREPAAAQAAADPLRHGHALLIGNSNYSNWPRLDDVPLQLNELAAGLKSHFDTVEVVKDLKIDALRQRINGFLRSYGNDPNARLFIYYAGHGYTEPILQYNEYRGYITGIDTPALDGGQRALDAARPNAMSMMEIRVPLAEVLAKHILIVFDSCFAGTIFLARESNAVPQELTPDVVARLMEKPSRDIITAGRANERVPAHSPLPKLFLAALNGAADPSKHGVISAAEINIYLRSQLLNLRGVNLTPQQGRLLDPNFAEGEFLFRVPNADDAADSARIEELKQPRTAAAVPVVPPATLAPCGGSTMTVSFSSRCATPLSSAEERALKPKDTFRECDNCPEMVVVPAGEFLMGSKAQGSQHEVMIAQPLAVGRYAVTFDEWDACVAESGCNGYQPKDEGWGRGKRPVIYVNWDDANAYAAWLSRKTGKTYRLLSEAEREFVARAGTTTAFWWGSAISTFQANYNSDYTSFRSAKSVYRAKTVPVDSFAHNPWGLYNVHGNVWEWVEDCWHDSYQGAPSNGSAWTTACTDGSQRVFRGGSWVDDPQFLRAAYRYGFYMYVRLAIIGFRLARTLNP